MGVTKDQDLTLHTMKNYNKKDKKDKKQNNIKIYPSNVRCYTCDEKGHFTRDYPIRKKGHHAHIT